MKPLHKIKGITFYPIPEVSDAELAFGSESSAYFDRYDLPEIPTEYVNKATSLMFAGGTLELPPEIDAEKATRAVQAWLTSYAPAHEAKMATVGYALWLWSNIESNKD